MRTLATARETNGSFELIEDQRNGGDGPAPHIHRHSDEAFYVLEGRFRFDRGSETIEAATGDLLFVPRGTRHRYRAVTDGSRVLILYVPAGGFDDFMRELDALFVRGVTSAEAIAAIGSKYDTDPA
jgi:mannose-6-phosphate isomerase-like protein (cupin superfamily)